MRGWWLIALLFACNHDAKTLAHERQGFATHIVHRSVPGKPLPAPPPDLFTVVHYPSAVGSLAAYLTPPGNGARHPAIIWITGGDSNTLDSVWDEAPPENDQSARAFREAGMVMMFPSLRGGNDNPGTKEGMYGEVDDIIAAADYLAKQPHVDPERIYLGGHSTGGTLVLLTAEVTPRFRAVFSFGPVDDVQRYGGDYEPFDRWDPKESQLREPIRWLDSIQSPVFVFEGAEAPSNIVALQLMEKRAKRARNPHIEFHAIPGANHFSVLAPTTMLIAQELVHDHLMFSDGELAVPFAQH